MSLVKSILKTVSNYPGGYRTIYSILYENGFHNKGSKTSIKGTLSRLKKNGLLSNKNKTWRITSLGKEMLLQKNSAIIYFIPKKPKTKQIKTTMVIFDIPEKKRKYRDWLRYELIEFGFELIQKSVWFGPTLSKEFIIYLQKEKLLQYIKFFKATENDLI
jgi:CRISPR-associated endonuclease Cas2